MISTIAYSHYDWVGGPPKVLGVALRIGVLRLRPQALDAQAQAQNPM